jgi:zinc finger FYVE domain-containing protein 26
VEQLCDELCYRLELAYFVAHVNLGKGRLASSARIFSKIGSKSAQEGDDDDDDGAPANSFAANLVLERLAMHSPVRVRILRSQQVNPSSATLQMNLDISFSHVILH